MTTLNRFSSIILILFLGTINTSFAQNVGITDTGALPNSHAILDVDISTNDKGILIPRLTTTQRTAITGLTTTDEGLAVYDETTKSFWFWNGLAWNEMSKTGDAWATNGNSGTTNGTHFIGTTDAQNLDIRTNNVIRVRITQKGQIEILNTGQSVFIGEGAGANDDLSTNQNTFVGFQAGNTNTTGSSNTANGHSALFFNTTGFNNTANGYKALYRNTTGYHNTANGYMALYFNTVGGSNTANGFQALYLNTTGVNNTANGRFTLYSNTTGSSNTATGANALYVNNTGSFNTATGINALKSNTTGSYNTANGCYALQGNTTGGKNTALGYAAFLIGATYTNVTALGYGAAITTSNQVRVGNSVVTSIGGQVGWSTLSDAQFKKDINENVVGLDFILKLRPVTYHLNMDAIAKKLNTPDSLRLFESEQQKENQLQTGFIAQEVEQTAKSLGYNFSGVDAPKNENDYYSLRYAEFVVPLVKAIQEQQKLIENQQKFIEQQQKEIDWLKKEVRK